MDANSGEPWSEADISTQERTRPRPDDCRDRELSCRDVYEVRAKMKELRLTEQPSKRRVVL